MSQFNSNSVVTFTVGASNAGAVETFQAIGREMDKLSEKQKKLAGGGDVKTASDRQINKALRQDSIGDLLEGLGISDKTLGVLKTGGLAVFGFTSALKGMSEVMNGINSGKAASQIWTDIAKGLPVIGSLASAAEEAGKAIANDLFKTDLVTMNSLAIDSAIESNRKSFKDAEEAIRRYAKALQEAMDRKEVFNATENDRPIIQAKQAGRNALASFADQVGVDIESARRAKDAANAALLKRAQDSDKRSGPGVIDEVASMVSGIDLPQNSGMSLETKRLYAQIAMNNKAFAQVEKQLLEESRKARDAIIAENAAASKKALDEKMDREKKAADDLLKIAVKAAKEKSEAVARQLAEDSALQDRIVGKQIDIENQIADIERQKQDRILSEKKAMSDQMRYGALAAGGGIRSANQLASMERASANPLINIGKEQLKKDDEQIQWLKGIHQMLANGIDPNDILGL